MESTNWLRQTDKPLFEDLLWSRPENRRHAGKLLIVGGHTNAFTAPSGAYEAALKAGVGAIRVMLPDSTYKLLGKSFAEAEFAPSTPSGSFSRQALAQLLENAGWADGVLLAGDLGHNSETAILLDSFIDKYHGQVTFSGDGLDYFLRLHSPILERSNTLIVAAFSQLQKLAKDNKAELNLKNSMNLHELVLRLGEWTKSTQACFISDHQDQIVVAVDGRVSTTPGEAAMGQLSAYAATWWLQQPAKPFEALTSAAYCLVSL
ncbi:hypothetical protein HY857_00815 [Candidatus Saccharibacteria bacterium]|nr:hypothetical protein [Candidatus Saccharibacteria bacterium]